VFGTAHDEFKLVVEYIIEQSPSMGLIDSGGMARS
jgi:hypothetical protein